MSAENVEGGDRPLFRELDPDDPDPEATVIDSLCMNCHEQVSFSSRMFHFVDLTDVHLFLGSDSITADYDPILQRSSHHVVFLSTLRIRQQPNPAWWEDPKQRS